MRITHLTVEGYRRFAEKCSVRLDGPVVALVGPNEAGKTSLIQALRSVDDEQPLGARNATRDLTGASPTITVGFELDEEDRAALRDIPGGAEVTRCRYVKSRSGMGVLMEPTPSHQLGPRKEMREGLEDLKSNRHLQWADKQKNLKFKWRLVQQLMKVISGESPLTEKGFSAIDALEDALRQASGRASGRTPHKPGQERLPEILDTLQAFRVHEAEAPQLLAEEVLIKRRPRFLFFGDDERILGSEYELEEVADDPPPPLANLAALADLDLRQLRTLRREGKHERVSLLLEQASRRLKEVFSKSWVMEDVVPKLEMVDSDLHIFVRTPGGKDLSRFDDRSDGFKWFVALVAFIRGQPEGHSLPVLLIDEAETHLSYDAQANLSQALANQTEAQLVIYSTHSAGCLPPDLGTGIRVVVPEDNADRSRIENGFWYSNQPGYTPLMLAMGANALAFTPTRRAVVAEGSSDCILLPTLLRQATGAKTLDFQIAPGLSNVTEGSMADVLSMAGQIAYLVDGDTGGEKLRNDLIKLGFPAEKIVGYRDVNLHVTLEDLVKPTIFIKAVNLELERWYQTDQRLTAAELPTVARMKYMKEWCEQVGIEPLSKPVLAQRLVELRDESDLVLARYRQRLQRLVDQLEEKLAPT